MRDVSKDEAAILFKLYRGGFFGAHHILEDNLLRGFPPDKVGTLRGALDRLKRDGIVSPKSTAHGRAVHLPPSLGREIYAQLKRHYSWLPSPPWGDR